MDSIFSSQALHSFLGCWMRAEEEMIGGQTEVQHRKLIIIMQWIHDEQMHM